MKLRSRLTGIAVVLVAATATAALYWIAFRGAKDADGPMGRADHSSVPVTVMPAQARSVQRLVPIVGTLYGLEEVPMNPKVEGRVTRILHDVGDIVKPGEVLFEIDPTDYELKVQEAERALELELAKLGLQRPPSTDSEVRIADIPTARRTASQRDLAQLEFDRAARLWDTQGVSQAEYERAQTDLVLAKANHEQSLIEGRTILAQVRLKEAALETAKEDLLDTRILVPPQPIAAMPEGEELRYVVAERTISEGEILRAMGDSSAPAFRLVIANPLKLKAAVAERFAGAIRVGQPAGLKTEATGEEIFYGEVTRVNPTVDRSNRTFRIEIEIPNEDHRLAAGGFAKAAVQTKVDPAAVTVPAEAIVRFAGVVKVFVVRGDKAVGVPVVTGERMEVKDGSVESIWIEITGDVQAGEQVVTSGQSQLADQTPVRIRTPEDFIQR